MAKAKYVFLNDRVVPWEEGRVHVSSAGFKFGAAVFEGIRGYWNEQARQMYLFRLHDHMQRLVHSQKFMRFDRIVESEYVVESTIELVRANEYRETVHIMPTVFIEGYGGPAVCGPVNLSITAYPGIGPGFLESGCSVQVSSWQRVADNAMPVRIKCNANYQNGRIATVQARADGYDAVLMLNGRGKVSEGSGQCFFMLRNGRIVTPSASNDILESITRETVIELLPECTGLEVEQRDVDRSELVSADEAFFCGTAWEVTPITSIDRLPVGTGEVGPTVRALQDAYFRIAKGETDDRTQWRTPVY